MYIPLAFAGALAGFTLARRRKWWALLPTLVVAAYCLGWYFHEVHRGNPDGDAGPIALVSVVAVAITALATLAGRVAPPTGGVPQPPVS